jgi:drug/metabolite transporter (DMT)-like permease
MEYQHLTSPKYLTFLLVAIIWGTTWTAIKVSLQGYPPFIGATLRFVIAVMTLALYAHVRRLPLVLPKGTKRWVIITAVLLYVIDYGLIYWSEQYLNAGVTAILFAALPLATALASALAFTSESNRHRTLAGILLGLGGTVIVFVDQVQITHFGAHVALACAAVVVAALAAALNVIIVKRRLMSVAPLSLSLHQMLWGSAGLGIIALARGEWHGIHYSAQATAALLYLSVGGSAAAFVMYYRLLRTMAASALSTISYVTPLVAVLSSWLLLNESLGPRVWVGMAVVFAGIAMVHFDHPAPIARPAKWPGLSREPIQNQRFITCEESLNEP